MSKYDIHFPPFAEDESAKARMKHQLSNEVDVGPRKAEHLHPAHKALAVAGHEGYPPTQVAQFPGRVEPGGCIQDSGECPRVHPYQVGRGGKRGHLATSV